MKHVFISTFGLDTMLANYGTFMQHFCLRTFLIENGYVVSRWNRKGDYLLKKPSFVWFAIKVIIRGILKGAWRSSCIRICAMAKAAKCFSSFVQTTECYQPPTESDVYVLGSDQVLGLDEFTWFGGDQRVRRKIIYAGSIDWTWYRNNQRWINILRRQLPSFPFVGLRESVGIDICQHFVSPGVVVSKVVDPTLLVAPEVIRRVESPTRRFAGDVLLCYFLNISCESDVGLPLLEKVASSLGCRLQIVTAQKAGDFVPLKYTLILSPSEFLAAIRDARYFVTNSFHGTVFSLLYRKEFVTIKQKCIPGSDQNIRQQELLSTVGLMSRYVSLDAIDCAKFVDTLSSECDYENISRRLASLRLDSQNWLRSALEGIMV